MTNRHSPPAPRRKSKLWPRRTTAHTRPKHQAHRWSTAALVTVAVGCVSFGLSSGFLLRGLRDKHVASRDAAPPGAVAVAAAKAASELRLVKRFQSFEEYAAEMMVSTEALPVPIVDSPAGEPGGPMALPVATIIGVQVTVNLCAPLSL